MTRARLTKPGNTDLHWLSVVCAPEATHVEFHEDLGDASDAARNAIATGVSAYAGEVYLQGESGVRSDSKTVVIEIRVDAETQAAIQKAAAFERRTVGTRKLLRNYLTDLLLGQLQGIRTVYGPVAPSSVFEPWAKCKSIDECEAMGRCCKGCQGRL